MRRWNKENHGWCSLLKSLRRTGLTLDQYHAKAEAQDFACAICGDDSKPLRIDHCHTHGNARGLLCDGCNTGIGLFKESESRLTKAQEYLRKWAPSQQVNSFGAAGA